MKLLLALVDGLLFGLRESCLAARPSERTSLAPVWVTPLARRPERR